MTIAKTENQVAEYLRLYLAIPENIQRTANIATMDLYFGPYSADNLESDEIDLYPSFDGAIKRLRQWSNELPSTLYVDLDCGAVYESEPEGYTDDETGEYIEPYLEHTWKLEGKEILKMIFDKELVSYL